ncbi:hypothetical protein [Bacteroides cellulosilyticus]|uniref:hypothetical protein n=1 Tax=Bacteroides cellulosilyticus TaxID=246787 RepID=UPI003562DA26
MEIGNNVASINRSLINIPHSFWIGDTKPIAGKLQEIGGRFNSHLSCGPGWIFSKKREKTVRDLLSA